jgi:hypothetical protein
MLGQTFVSQLHTDPHYLTPITPNSALQRIIDTKKLDYPKHYGKAAKRLNQPPED